MNRRSFIRNTGIATVAGISSELTGAFIPADDEFPLIDLHVHLTNSFRIDHLLEISKRTGVQFGVVVNPGYGVNDDASLNSFIETLRPYPVFTGLQPMSPGWSKSFSPKLISRLDYVLMDAQTIPAGNSYNETLRIWNFDTYVDDTEKFMKAYMSHILEVITNNEPLTVFGWPLFLPVCIARDYYTIWSDKRMEQIITALKNRKLVVEINDLARTPHERFINMAKEQGLKFTFGSDTRDIKAGRLDYCREIARKCRLKREDFFIPARKIG